MSIRAIDQNFHVADQITASQIADVARLGYKTVICMRPNHEGFNQPTFADVAAAAKAAGIDAHYIPVVPGRATPEQIAELKRVVDSRPGPVLAYCASGNRCASAYEMTKRG